MSQNKTIIPKSEYDLHHPIYSDNNASSEFYRPSGATINSTVISGTSNSSTPPPIPSAPDSNDHLLHDDSNSRGISLQDRVIVGVLFSISKGLIGELFPIYLGRNMIGGSSSCDIHLRERTVSDEHAVLHVRCDGYPGDCYLSITDYGSSHGTAVNQKDCRYDTLTVKDGDILTIGRHYRLSVKLFDIVKYGLYEDSDFEDIDISDNQMPTDNQSSNDFYSPSRFGVNDKRTVIG